MRTVVETAEVTLPSDTEVMVTRSFRAPRNLVYRAHTEPELVRRWMLGPPGWSMPVCEMDVRVGGAYRWRWRSEDSSAEFGFHGTFSEVQPESRLVHDEHYDPGTTGAPMGDGFALITLTFEGDGPITTITSVMDFGSKENRDGALATGMTDGMEQGYARLERMIADGSVR